MRDYSSLEHAEFPPSETSVRFCETIVGVPLGESLREYLLKYGYLANREIEFYGINGKQGMHSDMVVQTSRLHHTFPETENYIVFENVGDGVYAMVAINDSVVLFNSETGSFKPASATLDDYIWSRMYGDGGNT